MSTNQTNPIFDQIEEAAENQSKFVKLQANESAVFTFDTNKISVIDKEYQGKKSKRVAYTVTNAGGNEKVLELSLSWSLLLNDCLKAGYTKIKVSRKGSGLDTSYSFVPA